MKRIIIFLFVLVFIVIVMLNNITVVDDEIIKDKERSCIVDISHLIDLTFDRDKMINAYKKSFDYCKDYLVEGTGSLYICQELYFEKEQQLLNDDYLQIESFCRDNVAQFARGKCMFAVLNAINNNSDNVVLDSEICF